MLAISAGGYHSAAVLGFLKGVFSTHPERTDWHTIAGISAGALIGSKIAQIPPGDRHGFISAVEELMSDHTRVVHDWSRLGSLVSLASAFFWHESLFKSDLDKLVKNHWGERHRTLTVGAYNQSRGFYQSFDDPTQEQVVASASIPGVMPPVRMESSDFVDGAVGHVVPVNEIKSNLGKMDIDLMLCYPTTHKEYLKSCEILSKYKLVNRCDSTLNESIWSNMNRDLDCLSDLVGTDIRAGGTFKTGEHELRVYVPTKGYYVAFTHPSAQVLKRMHAHGEEVARHV